MNWHGILVLSFLSTKDQEDGRPGDFRAKAGYWRAGPQNKKLSQDYESDGGRLSRIHTAELKGACCRAGPHGSWTGTWP